MSSNTATSSLGRDAAAQRLMAEVRVLAQELHGGRSEPPEVGLDSRLEQDLGLDSLSRVELMGRLEAAFGITLPEQALWQAETCRDLLAALGQAAPAAVASPSGTSPLVQPQTEVASPVEAQTMTEILDYHAQHHSKRLHIRVLGQNEADPAIEISYGLLQAGARRVAGVLQARGLAPGDTVALMLPTGEDYFFGFFGILYAGGVPVPIYPPARPSQLADHLRRQAGILDNARCRFLLTVKQAVPLAGLLRAQVESLEAVLVTAELDGPSIVHPPSLGAEDLAFLQYTSGSTGSPKGVMLTHRNLLANIRADGAAIEAGSSDVFVSWLPLYHDMGLIGAWLGSLYFGAQLVIMSPLSFLARPARWLHAIHRYGGTLSASPNFGYQLCLARIRDEELQGLDLSRWRIAMNGAEPVSPDTVEGFIERFSPHGFAAEAMFPVYGLAENSVGLAFPPLHRPPRIDVIDRDLIGREGIAQPVEPGVPGGVRFVACGRALPGHELHIVGEGGEPLAERRQGRIQFRGPSATRGYYRNPEATDALLDGDWLETGDLGYIAEGDLFVTGRIKDIIIRGGRNIYPHELEEAVGEIDGIRKGRVVVFAASDPRHSTERLVVLAETRETDPQRRETLRRRINELTTDLTLTAADDIVLAPPGTVLKTSSGKIRRAAMRPLYEQGRLGESALPVWLQAMSLVWSALPGELRRWRQRLGDLLYTLYARGVFYAMAAVATGGVMLLPGSGRRQRFLGGCARLAARLAGIGLAAAGLERLPPPDRPCIFVSNHTSYLDSYAITAMLPYPFRFVAKAELAQSWLARRFLERIDVLFIQRQDRRKGIQAQQASVGAARKGDCLLYYPEGTFARSTGLRAFRMGAFMAAVEAGVPVVPIAIAGARKILAGDDWWVHRGDIRVTFCDALDPQALRKAGESDWQLALRLRDLSRQAILAHCGEPDLGNELLPPPDTD